MKTLLALLLLVVVPFGVLADARVELNTGTCHAPWSGKNADLEHKFNCSGFSIQHEDGTYTAQSEGTFEYVTDEAIDTKLTGDSWKKLITTCARTAGTFQDDDGNEYTTKDCVVGLTYTPTNYDHNKEYLTGNWNPSYDIHYKIVLRRAVAK